MRNGRTTKGPGDTLDYVLDWSGVIDDDPILSSSWSPPAGISVVADSKTDTKTLVRLTGGTIGTTYDVIDTIVTVGGQIAARTLKVRIVNK